MRTLAALALFLPLVASAQDADLERQVTEVRGQVDRVTAAGGPLAEMQAQLDAQKAQIAELRGTLDAQFDDAAALRADIDRQFQDEVRRSVSLAPVAQWDGTWGTTTIAVTDHPADVRFGVGLTADDVAEIEAQMIALLNKPGVICFETTDPEDPSQPGTLADGTKVSLCAASPLNDKNVVHPGDVLVGPLDVVIMARTGRNRFDQLEKSPTTVKNSTIDLNP